MTQHATPEATAAFASRWRETHPPSAHRALGRTGLVVSALGFGGYRVDDGRETHLDAMRLALSSGINLVDTSANYTDGGSERAIGAVLADLIGRDVLRRDEVVIVSKAGYVQGRNLARAHEREAAGRPLAEVVRYADGCWHCIHPEYLTDQLNRSLERMGLERLDALLLHNPEYFLTDAEARHDGTLADRRAEFDRRLRAAFAHLESEVDRGRITWYGVSSNTFVAPAGDAEATSLARMLEIAGDVAESLGRPRDAHRFAIAQLPFNLKERGAAVERNNPGGRTALEVAREHDLGVLVNRPLNAFDGGHLLRLADFPRRAPGIDVATAAAAVRELEDEFVRVIAPALDVPEAVPEMFRWGRELESNACRFRDALHWRQVETELVRPHVAHAISHVGLHLAGRTRNDWFAWAKAYEPALEVLLGAVADLSRDEAQRRADAAREALAPSLPAAWRSRPLSQQALAALVGTPGVGSVLVGMRDRAWVADALESLRELPPVITW